MKFDFDIDTASSFDPLRLFQCIQASQVDDKLRLRPHPCGVYFQNIPVDHGTGLSAIPYKSADALGFLKFDFLHVNVYDKFKNRQQIEALLSIEPDWGLLKLESVVQRLFQISRQYEIIQKLNICCIEDLGDLLALIRPQKRFLLDQYTQNKKQTRPMLYIDDGGGYSFKKGHAIAYAQIIILQLHLEKI